MGDGLGAGTWCLRAVRGRSPWSPAPSCPVGLCALEQSPGGGTGATPLLTVPKVSTCETPKGIFLLQLGQVWLVRLPSLWTHTHGGRAGPAAEPPPWVLQRAQVHDHRSPGM